jgi:hypothetical protein
MRARASPPACIICLRRQRSDSTCPHCVCWAEGSLAGAGRTSSGELHYLTTTPNELLADVHDWMPVILASEQRDRWLDPSMQDAATAIALLKTFDSNLMGRYPATRGSISSPMTIPNAPPRSICQRRPPPSSTDLQCRHARSRADPIYAQWSLDLWRESGHKFVMTITLDPTVGTATGT